ncbi:MAG: hypothetical protein EOP35_04095 [Rubrivivax sp.]|nr:MAG: hypothetical protein EOP35_04095 [Rubrivivax sp.]
MNEAGKRLYSKAPTAEELAAFGLRPEDVADQQRIELWPDTAAAFSLFCELTTQWRCGPGGFYGLDYAGVKATFELLHVPVEDWPALLSDLRDLESGALEGMKKK